MHWATHASRLALVALLPALMASDWRQFRGTAQLGVAEDAALPQALATENVAWKAALPGKGVSSPIVVDGRVVVTASSGPREERLHVLALDAATGKPLWERQFWATGRTLCHPTSAVAAPTPASDGQAIYAFFSSNDLVCLDLDGNLRWFRGLTYDYPTAANDVGMASSVCVAGETVVAQVESQGDSFAAGINTQTGESRWKVSRKPRANWASPIVLRGEGGRDIVLLQSSDKLSAHELESGRELWSVDQGFSTIASPAGRQQQVFVPGGGLTALELGAGAPAEKWKESRLDPSNASPVLDGDRLFTISRAGVLHAAEASTGKLRWQLRLKGPYWATPLVAAGHLYAVNQDGQVQVVRLGDDAGEQVATFELGEEVLGSPAAADGALFIRSHANLWKLAAR